MKKRYIAVILILTFLMTSCVGAAKKEESTGSSTKSYSSEATKEETRPTLPEITSQTETETATEPVTEVTTQSTTEQPKETVNGAEDNLPYYIKVNRAFNCITVYAKNNNGDYNVPYKAFACSVGDYNPSNPNSEPTPLGVFHLSDKYEWGLMVDGSYGRYACRIYSDILFHSVPYLGGRVKNGLETDQYNKLGENASLGCVRLNVRDAKWIFDNCPKGTAVEIYDDETTPGPLGKPDTIKIPEDSPYAGWDPTEEDPENPWNNFSASISGAADITIKKGAAVDILEGVTATDKCGNDITERIETSGSYDTKKAGTYKITYHVVDATGSEASAEINLVVE